jgi:hypothetical protein
MIPPDPVPIYRKTGYPVGTWREHACGAITLTFNEVAVRQITFWDRRRAHRHLEIRSLVLTKPEPVPAVDRFAHL